MKTQGVRILTVLLFTLTFLPVVWAQQFSAWSPRVNIGAPVNTRFVESGAFLSKDGLSLYFTRLECESCSSGAPQDIWVTHRETVNSQWDEEERLPATVNSDSAAENTPFVTIDGHYLFFISNRSGGYGGQDIYLSRRRNKRVDSGDGGWEAAVNLGPAINSSAREQSPFLFSDEVAGKITLYFNSNRFGKDDIFSTELQPDGTWGPVVPVAELNTPSDETFPVLSRDGLEMYFVSNRPGSMVNASGAISTDIWMSTRTTTTDTWSTPQPVTALNSPNFEGRPALSFDGTEIYFNTINTADECLLRGQCNMSPAWDIWRATREKVRGPDKH